MSVETTLRHVPKNQSAVHYELSNRALRWIGAKSTARGARGSTEIRVREGYVCDAIALTGLQNRHLDAYLKHSGLQRRTMTWHRGRYVSIEDDAIAIENELVCVFEAKATRSDFLSTFGPQNYKARSGPIGSLHWIVTPKGMVGPDEVPTFWGLLEASGHGLREVKRPQLFKVDDLVIHRLGYEILRQGDRWRAKWQQIPACPVCLSEDTGDAEKEEKDEI